MVLHRHLNSGGKRLSKRLSELVIAIGTGLLDRYAIGRAGAADILGDVANVIRLDRHHVASSDDIRYRVPFNATHAATAGPPRPAPVGSPACGLSWRIAQLHDVTDGAHDARRKLAADASTVCSSEKSISLAHPRPCATRTPLTPRPGPS